MDKKSVHCHFECEREIFTLRALCVESKRSLPVVEMTVWSILNDVFIPIRFSIFCVHRAFGGLPLPKDRNQQALTFLRPEASLYQSNKPNREISV